MLAVFERFTDLARRVVVLSQEEARRLGHNYIGTEHLLLGLLAVDGTAAAALTSLGASLQAAREQIVEVIGQGPGEGGGHIPFTPRAKKVLELSLREAMDLDDHEIGDEHILLGLLREGEGVAAQVLVAGGVSLAATREAVLEGRGGGLELGVDLGSLAALCTGSGAAAVLQAAAEAGRTGELAGPTHLLVGIAHDSGVAGRALVAGGLGPERLRDLLDGEDDPAAAPARASVELRDLLDAACRLAVSTTGPAGKPGAAHLLVVLLSPHPWSLAAALQAFGADPVALRRTALGAL